MADQLSLFADEGEAGTYQPLTELCHGAERIPPGRVYPILASGLTRGNGPVTWYRVVIGTPHLGWVTLSGTDSPRLRKRLTQVIGWSYAGQTYHILAVAVLPWGEQPPGVAARSNDGASNG